jgi:hypothetical protein
MKRFTTALFTAIFITAKSFAGDCPALSGDFTIGSSENADFNTINDAVNALKCGGISGPTTFLLEDGTYKERIVIGSIPGASAFNTVTFASKSGNNADVVISYGSSDATVAINGASYINIENLTIDHKDGTYGSALRADGKLSNLRFKGVVFNGVEVTRAASNSATVFFANNAPLTDIAIEDCEINNGSIGLLKGGKSADAMDSKTTINGNLFFNQYEAGLQLSNEDAPLITNNVVSTLSAYSSFKAINLDNAANNLIVSNNIVNAANGASGLAMNNCSGLGTSMGQVTNNSFAIGGKGDAYGVYLSGNTDHQVLNFNRIKLTIDGEQKPTQAFYRNVGSGNDINLLNNILYDLKSGGYTIIGNTYKDHFNQLPSQSNPALSVSANGLMVEKVVPVK